VGIEHAQGPFLPYVAVIHLADKVSFASALLFLYSRVKRHLIQGAPEWGTALSIGDNSLPLGVALKISN
jgi:hypothetical protein